MGNNLQVETLDKPVRQVSREMVKEALTKNAGFQKGETADQDHLEVI